VSVKELVDIILYDFLNRLIYEYNFPNLFRSIVPSRFIARKLNTFRVIDIEADTNVVQYRSLACYFKSKHQGKPINVIRLTKVGRGPNGCKITIQFTTDDKLYEFGQFDPETDNQMLSAVLRQSKNVNLPNIPVPPLGVHYYYYSRRRQDCYWCGSDDHLVTYEDEQSLQAIVLHLWL